MKKKKKKGKKIKHFTTSKNMSRLIVRTQPSTSYPMTRSQKKRQEEAEKILEDWKALLKISDPYDEIAYIEKFDGKEMSVYEPEWYSNRHQYFQYQGREMKYQGEETFKLFDGHNGTNKMFVVAETDEWLIGFQCIHHTAYGGGECATGFFRLMMSVVHK